MDLASGRVTELSSTSDDTDTRPRWSPDGKQIVFWRWGSKDMGGPIAPVMAAVFVVDADGQNLRQVTPKTLDAENPAWSPDGSRIVFTSPSPQDTQHRDIYTIRPDGTDLRRLTTDGISYCGDLDAGRADPVRPGFGRRGQRRFNWTSGRWTLTAPRPRGSPRG